MRVFPDSGAYASAAELYAGIMQAALVSPDDDGPCLLPDWVPVDADQPHTFCTLSVKRTWVDGAYRVAIADDAAAESQCMAQVYGPERHGGAQKAQFRFRAQGACSRMTVTGTRGRLLTLADTVRKQWALFGGGPKPAELVKPKAPRRATWPPTIVRVWLQQMECGADHAGAVLTGERIDARFYPGNTTTGGFVLAAPMQVDGLPDGMVSAVRNDGRWVVADHASGLKLGNGVGSRKAAETEALKLWSDAPEEKREHALKQARATLVDHDAARDAWCAAHGIMVDDPADLQPAEPAAEDVAQAQPEPAPAEPAHVEPEPIACTPSPGVGEKADAEEQAFRLGQFKEMIRLRKEREARELAAVGDLSDGGILRGDDGRRYVMVLPDVDGGGRWRIQRFDAQGFSGHEVFPGMLEAAKAAVGEGFKARDDGALDALASRPEWARGMFICDLIQRMNGGQITRAEADRLLAEFEAQQAPPPCVVEMRNEAPAAEPAPDVAIAFTLAAEQLRDLAGAIEAPGARRAARPILARRWALGGIRRQRRAFPPTWRGADAMRRPSARCGLSPTPPPAWGKLAQTSTRNTERRMT